MTKNLSIYIVDKSIIIQVFVDFGIMIRIILSRRINISTGNKRGAAGSEFCRKILGFDDKHLRWRKMFR